MEERGSESRALAAFRGVDIGLGRGKECLKGRADEGQRRENSEGQKKRPRSKPDLTVNTVPVSKLCHWIKEEKNWGKKTDLS